MVAVNVSPIDRGHVLLVPEPTSCLPQVNEPPTVQCKLFPSFVLFVLVGNDTGFAAALLGVNVTEWSQVHMYTVASSPGSLLHVHAVIASDDL